MTPEFKISSNTASGQEHMEISTLLEIAEEVISSIRGYLDKHDDYDEIVKHKTGDVTRTIDMVAERALETSLSERDICARIISEELGDRIFPEGGEASCTLVFDPVDGSTNSVIGIPFFCTSIAYSPQISDVTLDDIRMGVVKSITDKTYHAVRNEGAYVNGERIPQDKKIEHYKPVLTVYWYGVPHVPKEVMKLGRDHIIRSMGSAALEMCLVAERITDGFIDPRGLISAYDIMASGLILKEAGGALTDAMGEDLNVDALQRGLKLVGTTDPKMHEKIINILSGEE